MAYRLERDESVIAGLKRVVRDEMESAGAQLTGNGKTNPAGNGKTNPAGNGNANPAGSGKTSRDEAIHEARKSIKKVRALLRLVRGELGVTGTRENERMRDIAHRLAGFRDAFAIVETFDDLRIRYQAETRSKLQSVRRGLAKRRNQGGSEEDVGLVLAGAADALRRAAKRVKAWPLETDGFAAIGPGLEETFRAGRNALARARKEPRPENYHEFRKRVKEHWYHLRLLEGLWTRVMIAYEKSLKDLETWLGDDHNLFVLREKLVAEPAFYGKPKDIELALDLIDRYQKDLRDRSLSLAERIYDEKPREFTRRMKRLWDTWHQEPSRLEEPRTAA